MVNGRREHAYGESCNSGQKDCISNPLHGVGREIGNADILPHEPVKAFQITVCQADAYLCAKKSQHKIQKRLPVKGNHTQIHCREDQAVRRPWGGEKGRNLPHLPVLLCARFARHFLHLPADLALLDLHIDAEQEDEGGKQGGKEIPADGLYPPGHGKGKHKENPQVPASADYDVGQGYGEDQYQSAKKEKDGPAAPYLPYGRGEHVDPLKKQNIMYP